MTERRGSTSPWILASASPRRREILARLGLRFSVDPSRLPEPERGRGESPSRYVLRAACLKANEAAARHPHNRILAADTIVTLDDSIFGKPADQTDARSMLRRLNGRWHEVLSGLSLLDSHKGVMHTSCIRSRVHFRRLSSAEIDWYLHMEEYRELSARMR